MGAIDTHCHLNIVEEFGVDKRTALKNAGAAGVEAVLQIATGPDSSRDNASFARAYAADKTAGEPELFWTAGLHPEAADKIDSLDEIFAVIREHRDDPAFVGVGETGLDYYHTVEFVKEQHESLDRHFALAAELKLPVVVHLRDDRTYTGNSKTAADALEILDRYPGVRGVLHSFTYTYEEAAPFIERGWFVSYSGIVTFKNAKLVQAGAAQVPLDRLMVETDAPFLAPVPHRGKTNEPAFVVHTLEFMLQWRAEQNGEDPETVRAAIHENSRRFLNLKNEPEARPPKPPGT